jgi:hypothetical protein
MGGACSKHGEMINKYKILVGEHKTTRQHRRPPYRWIISE